MPARRCVALIDDISQAFLPTNLASDQPAKFSCPNGRAFFSSSIVWGVIGPYRMFGTGSIYQYFNVFWVIGAVLPCILYAVVKYGGRLSWIGRTLHAPVMLGAMGWLPPATPLSFSTWGMVALIFNHFIKNRFHGWWRQYNYVTAAALDAGLIISTIVIFFAIVSMNSLSLWPPSMTWTFNSGSTCPEDRFGGLEPTKLP